MYCCCCFRLKSHPDITTCCSERKLIALYKASPAVTSCLSAIVGDVNPVSFNILKRFHGIMLESCSPRSIVGDGNCLFRTVSLALYATQNYHMYLRILTAIDIICNRSSYDDANPLHETPIPPSPYTKLLNDVLSLGTESEMSHIFP